MTQAAATTGAFVKFHQFAKLEESEDGKLPTVWGIATLEQPDLDNECCIYEDAVPVYQAWAAAALKRTKKAGQELSMGPIRLQHGSEVGGKATKLTFDDAAKEIWLGAEPISDEVHKQLKKGFYTGFSQGGSYAWRACATCETALPLQQSNNWCPNCDKLVMVNYGLKRLAEVSFVDSPCTGEGFESVKVNGSTEIIKFQRHKEAGSMAKTKTVAGVALTAECFAYVGDPEKTSTWKLPIKFPGDDAKTKSHIRNALARFDQTQGIPADKKAEVKAKIHAAATTHGIDVAVEHGKSAKVREMLKAAIDKGTNGVTKNLWDVARAADLLQSIACLWEGSVWEREIEGDESEVPDELKELLDGFIETFIAMAEEEARELAARNNKKGDAMTPEELELQKAAKKSLATHFAKMAAHHEKMADNHEAIAEGHETKAEHHEKAMGGCEECMGKAAAAKVKKAEALKAAGTVKADTDPEDETGAHVDEILSNQMTFHKGMATEEKGHAADHMKCAKAHDKAAETYTKMAEAHDESGDKAVVAEVIKTERAAFAAEPEPELKKKAPAKVTDPTMEEEVALAQAALKGTPEYKARIAEIAKQRNEAEMSVAQARIDAEVAKLREATPAPLGKLIGQKAEPGTVAAVPRSAEIDPSTIKLASRPSDATIAGM